MSGENLVQKSGNNFEKFKKVSREQDEPANVLGHPSGSRSLEELCAIVYAGSDWHKLTSTEREIIERLESSGYLTINNPANGFVGKVSIPENNKD